MGHGCDKLTDTAESIRPTVAHAELCLAFAAYSKLAITIVIREYNAGLV